MRFLPQIAAMLGLYTAVTAWATPPSGYYEVWGDEFNGTSLDPTKWAVWNQPDRSGYSTPAAVTVGGGYMTILVYSTNGQNYSGIVTSDPHFRGRFGYMESSVEFNGAPGMFSDFWINSADNGAIIGNPAASGVELDICEHRVTDANDEDNISGQVTVDMHWNGYGSSETSASSGLIGTNLGAGFHTYGCLWTSNGYAVSFDGTNVWSTNGGISKHTEVIMFSCEIDSNSFCGIVPTGGYGDANESTTSTVVDYLRYYAPTTTAYWVGDSSVDWSDAGNYVSNMVPASDSDVVFSFLTTGYSDVYLDQDVTINSLSIQESPSVTLSGNPLTINGGGLDMNSAWYGAAIDAPVILGAAQTWNIASGIPLYVNNTMSGAGNLTLGGLGTLVIEGTNDCTGTTTVSAGSLLADGLMTGPITVAGGTLAGTGVLAGAVVVNSGTLSGTETLTGPVTINAGGVLEPGSPTGTLIISNTLSLLPGSSTLMNIDKTAGGHGQVGGLTSVSLGGTLIISNLSAALAPGDTFSIISAGSYLGSFSRVSPASPGPGLAWDIAALSNGIVHVISTNGGILTAQMFGQQVTVSWPLNNLGWQLQAQTNSPGGGITTNWVNVAGSAVTNLLNLNINPVNGSVFFRLACPPFSTSVFGNGDVVVLQVGNGSISSSGAPGQLNDYSSAGGPAVIHISLPTTGAGALVFGGSSYDGVLSLSADGHSIVIPGYNVAIGYTTSSLDSSSTGGSTPVPRAVGSVSANGTFTLNATTTQFSGSTIRSGMADGNGNFWAGGGASGIVYLGLNSPGATVSTISTSTRDLAFENGNIYFTETGSGQGIMGFSGAPTSSSTPSMIVSTVGTGSGTPSPKGFAINPAMTIAYVADNRASTSGGGIQRFNWNGSSWIYAYTLVNNLTSSKEVEDIAVNFSGANPIIYAITGESTGNHLVTVPDTNSSATFVSLETAPSGDAFRGITFAPSP